MHRTDVVVVLHELGVYDGGEDGHGDLVALVAAVHHGGEGELLSQIMEGGTEEKKENTTRVHATVSWAHAGNCGSVYTV